MFVDHMFYALPAVLMMFALAWKLIMKRNGIKPKVNPFWIVVAIVVVSYLSGLIGFPLSRVAEVNVSGKPSGIDYFVTLGLPFILSVLAAFLLKRYVATYDGPDKESGHKSKES